jgi:nucleoside-triphosphatase
MNIFITGNPGCGKSTLIKKILEILSDKKVSGFITPEIRVSGKRQGFMIIDLASSQEEILASANMEHGFGISRYRIHLEGIDKIINKFLESYSNSDYVVIDEIGMMEFCSKKFREMLQLVLKSQKKVIATLSRKFVKEYEDQGEIFSLTRENFEETYRKLLGCLDILPPTE